MNTENMDIVYTFKEKPRHDELKYSLRSLKNLPHNKVWIYGDCPDWVNRNIINFVESSQGKGNKWLNVSALLEAIAQNDNISENFIWMNDDFFILKEIKKLDYFYDRTLVERVSDFYKLGWARMNTGYTRRLQFASRALKWKKKSTMNFELHLPMVFNRQKLSEVIKEFPTIGAKRSLYGNCYVENPIARKDCKIFNNEDEPTKDWDFVSTSDGSFLEGAVGKYIKNKFKKKCEYESD